MNWADQYSTWVEIDLDAIEGNVHYFTEMSSAQVMAVVKANAYGHGSAEVAAAALRGGASWLSVARVEEALQLRAAGIEASILILGHTPHLRVEEMLRANIALTIWEKDQIARISKTAQSCGVDARLHLKVDTGMSRLGVQPTDVLKLAQYILQLSNVIFEGVFTHMARGDEKDPATTDHQFSRFQEIVRELEDAGVRPTYVHCANSATALKHIGMHMDLVRVGIALYGLQPSAETGLPSVIRPALAWKSTLTQVKTLPPGRGISYGHAYTTKRVERIGTIPVGYADGYRRITGNRVLVAGRSVSVVGRVTMDQIMVNLDNIPEAQAGDEVILLGSDAGERISAEDLALQWGTINYEVTSGIAARVPRVFIQKQQ